MTLRDLDSDVDHDQMTHSDEPTTEKERKERYEFLNSPALQHNPLPTVEWELRLIADVNMAESRMQSLKDDAGDMLCELEDQVKRLEAERGCPQCPHCHPDSRWP